MTWFSRLLPPSRSLGRLAAYNRNRRPRQGQRRRLMSSLESLERRALLAGNVTVGSVVGGVLAISGDNHNDTFTITEDGGNAVTVTGSATTTIDNTFSPVTRYGVDNITVTLPHGLVVNTDNLTVLQTPSTKSGIANFTITVVPSSTTSPIVATELFLTVVGVTNTGEFTVSDGTATSPGGGLYAGIVDGTGIYSSNFGSISITQSGCCPAYVTLQGDNTPGPVSVTEGWDYGDQVLIALDKFGSTTVTQGFGPGEGTPGNFGAEQDVNIQFSYFANLTVTQNGSGGTDETIIFFVEVQLASFGIVVEQPNSGGADIIYLESITTLGRPTNRVPAVLDSIVTSQGNGGGDLTVIDSALVYGNITASQGNGDGDYIYILATEAGFAEQSGPIITEIAGNLTISQGDGYEDVVVLANDGSEYTANDTFNNVTILQGDSTPPSISCYQITGDLISIDATIITSDLFIEQGVFGTSYGENVVAIATNYLGIGTVNSSTHVSVGDSTYILENGASSGDNSIYLGGVNPPDTGYSYDSYYGYDTPDFETAYLDVYTGALGGAYVQVFNTVVDVGNGGVFGSFGAYEFEGGDGSNIAVIDYFSFYYGGVDADPAVFNILLV